MLPTRDLAFIGAGRMGQALAVAAVRSGYTVTAAASRSAASAAALCAAAGGRPCATPAEAAALAPVVVLTVPDGAIATVAAAVSWQPGQVVLHTSGALDSAVLSPARAAGAAAGSLHPLQTLVRAEDGPALLRGATFALEGDPAAVAAGRALAEALGGHPLELAPGAKVLYHAAAVCTSNYIVALAAMARRLWAAAGLPPADAVPALLPLMQGAVTNLGKLGVEQALTGPVARGDTATVARHLQALAEQLPDLLPAYQALGLEALNLGPGHPDLQRLLASPPGGRSSPTGKGAVTEHE